MSFDPSGSEAKRTMSKFDSKIRETPDLLGEKYDEELQLKCEKILDEIAAFGQLQDGEENRQQCSGCGVRNGEDGARVYERCDAGQLCEECYSELCSKYSNYGVENEDDEEGIN